jgi:hypothetical protein
MYCLDQTESIYLDKYRKNVYPYNRRFLPPKHPLQKKGKHFNGKAETWGKPVTRDNTASESSQVTYTSITSKPST